jgi:hypothetical protein
MLTLYRRHQQKCRHRNSGRKYRRCRCPVWVDGMLGEREIRESLGTTNWDKAQEIVREWEADGHTSKRENAEPITIVAAVDDFIADAAARELKERTIYKYSLTFRQLRAFAEAQGVGYLKQLDPQLLRKFRSTWKDHNLAALKKLDRLRAFFRFVCFEWLDSKQPCQRIKGTAYPRPANPAIFCRRNHGDAGGGKRHRHYMPSFRQK